MRADPGGSGYRLETALDGRSPPAVRLWEQEKAGVPAPQPMARAGSGLARAQGGSMPCC